MAPANRTDGAIQSEFGSPIRNDLAANDSPCSVVITPGTIPQVQSNTNFRIPDLAVTYSSYDDAESPLAEPAIVVEILSPSDQAETWASVWAYVTIPSVQEILVAELAFIGAHVLRRNAVGSWPDKPSLIDGGDLKLDSIGFSMALRNVYRTTRLA